MNISMDRLEWRTWAPETYIQVVYGRGTILFSENQETVEKIKKKKTPKVQGYIQRTRQIYLLDSFENQRSFKF